MNKLAIFAIVCLSATLVSSVAVDYETESQFAVRPSDEEESAYLDPETSAYASYCIDAREKVFSTVKSLSNSQSKDVFSFMVSSAIDLLAEAAKAQTTSLNRIGKQIENPESPIEDTDGSVVEETIAEGQRDIQANPSQPNSLFAGLYKTLLATSRAVGTSAAAKFAQLSNKMGLDVFSKAATYVCENTEDMNMSLKKLFRDRKNEIKKINPTIIDLSYEDVPCVTAWRVQKLDSFCKFGAVAKGPLQSMVKGGIPRRASKPTY